MRATIGIVPFRWKDDWSYMVWNDSELRNLCSWQMDSNGQLEISGYLE